MIFAAQDIPVPVGSQCNVNLLESEMSLFKRLAAVLLNDIGESYNIQFYGSGDGLEAYSAFPVAGSRYLGTMFQNNGSLTVRVDGEVHHQLSTLDAAVCMRDGIERAVGREWYCNGRAA
ncbi:hypothetical protein [Pseudoroseicyclus tamaricis]|uniref:Uncharacterized protein n=1 Tax=Pseudoroseicyclus tamaricis TaxID=2705421 RepID=A0A6B2JSI9_9RHOB|nr:hypothetical protein [Pseudoroseicyclus tamaricis]NDV00985.1 hypothetical protein [Pseudoroseicyclus tamaricis]